MKYIYLVLALFSTLFAFCQDEYLENFQQKHLVFPGCEGTEDHQDCFDRKLQDFVVNNISKSDSEFIVSNRVKDTLRFTYKLFFDKYGILDKADSKIWYGVNKKQKTLTSLIDIFPEVKPLMDEVGRGVNTHKNGLLFFAVQDEKLSPIYDYVPAEVPFSIIENVPIYKGCDPKALDNAGLKKCMSKKIGALVAKKFNIRKTSKGMPSGTVKIYAMFKVGKDGEVRDIKVRAPNKKLEKETRRVLKLIPKLEKPGYQRGKPVIVPYSLPIVFRVK